MNNKEELEKKTGIKHFDICLMNPPYGMRTDTIHLKFVDEVLKIADKQVTIMPFKFIYKDHKNAVKYKKSDIWNNELVSVEEVNSEVFKDTAQENVAIYYFDKDNDNDTIVIDELKGKTEIDKLYNYTRITSYEQNILNYLENDHISENVVWGGGYGRVTKQALLKQGITDKETIKQRMADSIRNTCKNIFKLKNKHYYLLLSHVAGTKFFSDSAGNICKDIKEFEEHAVKCNFGKGFQIMGFESLKEAENCKNAMERSLLRFGFILSHPGLDVITRKSYKYVPDIDWSDDRTKTDEGILELCGCPKDKIKEYIEYCKTYVKNIDNES